MTFGMVRVAGWLLGRLLPKSYVRVNTVILSNTVQIPLFANTINEIQKLIRAFIDAVFCSFGSHTDKQIKKFCVSESCYYLCGNAVINFFSSWRLF